MHAHDANGLYLDLMKECLTAIIYDESAWYVLGSLEGTRSFSFKELVKRLLVRFAWRKGLLLVKPVALDLEAVERRKLGRSWPLFGYTMIGLQRLNNIQTCIENVLRDGVEGDLIEAGAWRGGATIFMRAVLKYYGVRDRIVWVADSFEGLPALTASQAQYADDLSVDVKTLNNGGPMQLGLSVSLEKVKSNFAKFNLLDDQVRFLKGWFRDTLPAAPIDKLALLRLDGDMYQSTMDTLVTLHHKVSAGGYVIVDDYYCWPHCKQAVDDFRQARGIVDQIENIDLDAVYWRVSARASDARPQAERFR
jgi:O-methyltransferase